MKHKRLQISRATTFMQHIFLTNEFFFVKNVKRYRDGDSAHENKHEIYGNSIDELTNTKLTKNRKDPRMA